MIAVINRNYGDRRRAGDVDIMRPSILGNPFKIGRDGTREQVIAKYRVWLWVELRKKQGVYREIMRIAELSKTHDVRLRCCCKPLPCHGDIIVRCVEWILKGGEIP